MNLFSISILLGGGIILTIGDISIAKWVQTNKVSFFIAGLLIWLIGLIFLAWSFKYQNIAIASVIFVLFNVITLLLYSWIYMKDKVTPLQIAGLIIGIISIIILEISEK